MISDPSVTILNVGHGNSAVIRDGAVTIVVDTGGEHVGTRLLDYLKAEGIVEIDALLLSHADEDHIGSAPTLLLSDQVGIKKVFLNSDSTKRTAALRNLQLALGKARREKGTQVETSLTTQQTGLMPKMSLRCDILYPSPESVVSGPGGRGVDGGPQSTNSLSAVVRVSNQLSMRVLLPGDSGLETISFWQDENVTPEADVIVFPHHGGRPGTADPAVFAREFSSITRPAVVVFSLSKTKHDLPRDDVVDAIRVVCPEAHLICTQLPERLETKASEHPWTHHWRVAGLVTQLHVRVRMSDGEILILRDSAE